MTIATANPPTTHPSVASPSPAASAGGAETAATAGAAARQAGASFHRVRVMPAECRGRPLRLQVRRTRARQSGDGAFAGGTQAYRASLESAAVHGVSWARVHPGDTLQVDDVTFRFLAPDSAWTAQLRDANLASTVVRVEYGQHAMLLTGDAEEPEEQWLLDNTPLEWLRADVLKVGHHGSKTSSGAAFLDAVQPHLALISVGRGNTYGHPSSEVTDRLAERQITVVRTDMVGTTVIRSDGRSLTITTAPRSWLLPSPASVRGSASRSSSPSSAFR